MAVTYASQKLITDLNERVEFARSQDGLGLPAGEVLQEQADAFLCTVETLVKLAIPDAAAITRAFKAGPWSTDQKKQVAKALTAATTRHAHSPGTRHNQNLEHAEDWFTSEDWDVFLDKTKSMFARSQKCGTRLYKLNIPCPSQRLLKTCGAMLVACGAYHNEDLTGTTRRQVCQDIQAATKSLDAKRRCPLPHITDYPATFESLPTPYRGQAYGAGVPIVCPGDVRSLLAQAYNDTAIRKTHRSVRCSPADSSVRIHSPSQSPPTQLMHPTMGADQMMMHYVMQTLMSQANGGGGGGGRAITFGQQNQRRTVP